MAASHLTRSHAQQAICMVTVEATFHDIPTVFIISSQLFDIYPSLEISLLPSRGNRKTQATFCIACVLGPYKPITCYMMTIPEIKKSHDVVSRPLLCKFNQ